MVQVDFNFLFGGKNGYCKARSKRDNEQGC